MNTTETPVSPPPITTEDKTAAIVSYLTLIGFIVAVVIHGSRKTRLGAFHLRQSLGLMLASIALGVVVGILMVIPFIGWILAMGACLAVFVFWVMGLIAAAKGEMKPVPVLGASFQRWFGSAFD